MKTHRDLEAWKRAIDFVTEIYRMTKSYPEEEKYGLINQIRRAAVSIPSNIAEGAARKTDKENIQFSYISLGSLSEVETQLIISQNLEYLTEKQYEDLSLKLTSIRKPLIGLINFFKN